MTSTKSILAAITNCKMGETVITDYKLEYPYGECAGECHLHVWVRPRKGQDDLCPHCHRHCSGYDCQTKEKIWRGLDLGGVKVFLHGRTRRVYCPHCKKTVTAEVPWAFHKSGFTKYFDLTVTYLALHANKSVVSKYMRCAWATVMNCISRAREYLEPDRRRRYENLVNIGIDETSYRKGYKYLTVVVNHDTNEVVWVHEQHGTEILRLFFEELTEEQRKSIKTVSGDGAKWIDAVMKEYVPHATRCMDAFHVVERAMKAMDEVRLACQREASKALAEEQKKGMPSKRKLSKLQDDVKAIKGSKYAVGKAHENLTPSQWLKLMMVAEHHPKVFRASMLREMLRKVFQIKDPAKAKEALVYFIFRASHSRLEPFKALSRKIKERMEPILNTTRTGVSNARVESNNNLVKLIIRKAFGYRNIQNLFDMILLTCSNISIPLPYRSGEGLKAV